VLFTVIVFVPAIRRSRQTTDPLSGVDPPPAMTSGATSGRRQVVARLIPVVVAVAGLVVVFVRGDRTWTFQVTQAVILAVIFLSITVITGFAGRISLCQGAFAAIGAFAAYQLVDRYDVSVLAAGLIGAVIAGAVGALVSLPLRRLSGIWVAIATLAFAYFFDSVLVKLPWLGGTDSFSTTKVVRPRIGPWDFASDKTFLALALVVLIIVASAVTLIQRGTTGRTLTALRGSEVAAQSIGIAPGRAYLRAFSISASIAGLGGALLAMQQQNVNYGTNFSPFAAMFWLVIVVTIGVRSVEGALVAAAAYSLFEAAILKGAFLGWILRSSTRIPDLFPIDGKWVLVLFGLGTIQYARHPEGILQASKQRAAARAQKRAGRGSTGGDPGARGPRTTTPVIATAGDGPPVGVREGV
jgi:ABC-type branched-subunit amino acid transport system permease subunit